MNKGESVKLSIYLCAQDGLLQITKITKTLERYSEKAVGCRLGGLNFLLVYSFL